MSHAETIHRLNAAMNTPDTWAQRWQVEREANERLEKQAGMLRTAIHAMRAASIKRYGSDKHPMDGYMVRAFTDVIELMDRIAITES